MARHANWQRARSSSPRPLMRWTLALTAGLTVLASGTARVAADAAQLKTFFKVNLGGDASGDFLAESSVIDMEDFSRLRTATAPIAKTDNPDVFRTQRFGRSENVMFRIPVPDGVYSVTLLFAETWEGACRVGGRVFDVLLGTPQTGLKLAVQNFDIFREAGGFTAFGKRFDAVPSAEGILVVLQPVVQNPQIAGFIVEGFPLPRPDGSQPQPVGMVADAGPAYQGVGVLGIGDSGSGGDAGAGGAPPDGGAQGGGFGGGDPSSGGGGGGPPQMGGGGDPSGSGGGDPSGSGGGGDASGGGGYGGGGFGGGGDYGGGGGGGYGGGGGGDGGGAPPHGAGGGAGGGGYRRLLSHRVRVSAGDLSADHEDNMMVPRPVASVHSHYV